jgi:hypothetical protein
VSVAVTTATANVSNLTVVLRDVTEDVGTPLPTPLLQILDIGSLLSSTISISDVTFRRDREMVLLRNVSESIVRTTLVLSHVTSSSYFPIVMCDTVAKSFLNCALILVNVSQVFTTTTSAGAPVTSIVRFVCVAAVRHTTITMSACSISGLHRHRSQRLQ